MTVYSVNLGIGWASSGVEYAQKYRNECFKRAGIDCKFIFSDLILENNIEALTANLGFNDQEIIWLYNFFTNVKIAPSSCSLNEIEESLDLQTRANEIKKEKRQTIYKVENDLVIVVHLDKSNYVDQVIYERDGRRIKRDFYSYVKYASEYYLASKENNRVAFREFFNEDGSLAYTQHLNNDKETFEFAPGEILYSKDELYLKMLEELNFSERDAIILDRIDEDKNLINGQLIFENHGPAKLITVVHAEHFSKHYTDERNILWNNFYEYEFSHAQEVDSFVVATEKQKDILQSQFKKYYDIAPKIVCIPVGSLLSLTKPKKARQKYSLITASRLAKEKHVDWIIKAVIAAKEKLPDLKLDIYGQGGEKQHLEEIIKQAKAEKYIKLCGQKNLAKIYVNYQAYIAASTSEGFGLSLLEAVNSGLAMIGFDVPYGNPTFIKNGKNGILLPYNEDWKENKKVIALTQAIIELFDGSELTEFHENSYLIAKNYLTAEVAKKWKQLLEEIND